MPTNVYWIDEPWIMGVDYMGHVTEQEVEAVMHTCLEIVDNRPCYFLADTLPMTSIQPSLFKIGALLRFVNHPNNRWLALVVGQNPLIKFAVQVMMRKSFTVVDNREKALEILRARVQEDQKVATSPKADV
jgi:hypothetical protein